MIIEFAPMEGVTDVVFRRAHFEMFGGVDRYFLPFISTLKSSSPQCAEIAVQSSRASSPWLTATRYTGSSYSPAAQLAAM